MDNKNNVFETLGHSEGSEKEQDPIDLKLVRTGGEGGPLYYLSYGIDGKDVEQKNDGYLDMEKAIEYANKNGGKTMTVEKGHICRDLEKIKPGGFAVMGIIVTAVIAVVIAAVLEQDNTESCQPPEGQHRIRTTVKQEVFLQFIECPVHSFVG